MGGASCSHSTEPNATTKVLKTQGKIAAEVFFVQLFEIRIEEFNPKLRIVLEKGSKQIEFVEGTPLLDPTHGVFKRIEDIMNMNIDS